LIGLYAQNWLKIKGRGGATEKIPKISKKYRKITLFASPREGGHRKKDRNIAKTGRKIAILSLYLQYLYHV